MSEHGRDDLGVFLPGALFDSLSFAQSKLLELASEVG